MSRQIIVSIKNNYGNEVIYPVCPNAEKFASIAGTRTLTLHTIAMIKSLGFELVLQQPQSSLASRLVSS